MLRDDEGVPQIYADNAQDLFRAQGFVQAQDRFFEMDLRRHITAGRLSEMVGTGGLETDRVIRTMGWRRVAEAELPTLEPETRQYLQAYADGVNAYIDQQGSPAQMALEYVVLSQKVPDYRVEPWTPVDSLAWLKAMAWDLRGDYDDELTRARLFGRVPLAQINELYPPYPYDQHPPILSAQDWRRSRVAPPPPRCRAGRARPAEPAGADHSGSQGRVCRDAARARTGPGHARPGRRHRLELVGRRLCASRAPGSRCWPTTRTSASASPASGTRSACTAARSARPARSTSRLLLRGHAGRRHRPQPVDRLGHDQPGARRQRLLPRAGPGRHLPARRPHVPLSSARRPSRSPAGATHTITVRSTVHGPILSEALPGRPRPGARRPSRDGPTRVTTRCRSPGPAWCRARRPTRSSPSTRRRASTSSGGGALVRRPCQNLVYADRAGHIGYQAPGRIPIRRSATPGAAPGYWPTAGLGLEWDWKGYVPFEQMPHTYDPPEGFLVTANQAVTASPTPFLTTEWDYGFRAQRIRTLLEKQRKVTPDAMWQIQGDTRNEFAPTLVKALLNVNLGSDDFTKEAQDLLRDWDFSQPIGSSDSSAAAAYYNAVWSNLLQLTFNDELPDDLRADGGGQWMQAIVQLLQKPRALVGQQAHPRRHRGRGRDPPPGHGRGPAAS